MLITEMTVQETNEVQEYFELVIKWKSFMQAVCAM